MWRKLRKQIAVELEMLHRLLDEHRPLLVKCAQTAPDRVELSALAAMLHWFYSGMENIFKRVAIELGEPLSRGEAWHSSLLEQMTVPGPQRPPVISTDLADTLREYLRFRHFFRGAYPFLLEWERMRTLVEECPRVLKQIDAELGTFMESTKDQE